MNDREWNGMQDILETERAVVRAVAEARPYIRYRKGDLATVYADGRWVGIPPDQRRTVFTRAANLDDGIIITKHPVPGEPPVLSQMRPDHPVRIRLMPRDRAGHDHDTYGPNVRKLHAQGQLHYGEPGTPIGLHSHVGDGTAKYLLAPKGYVDVSFAHVHKPRTAAGHVAKPHDDPDGEHRHTKRVKDPHMSPEKRLDMNPLAAEVLPGAERVFFSIEGSIKADALLSKGECSFAVPSVTMWSASELDRFARLHLSGKRVYVVPDADWSRNPLVSGQAFLCADYLTRRGVRAAVASSPEAKGIDDHLAAGGTVDEMVVQERRMSVGFNRWARDIRDDPYVRKLIPDKRARERLIDVVRLLGVMADADGLVVRPGRSLCNYVGFSFDRLRRTVAQVTESDWGDPDHPLAPFLFAGELDGPWWTPVSVFELRRDLRARTVSYPLAVSPP